MSGCKGCSKTSSFCHCQQFYNQFQEIIEHPQLIYEGQSRFDVVQGELGDCWLLAAAANLTLRDELFYRVVPPDQSFTENYAGGFFVAFLKDEKSQVSVGHLQFHYRDIPFSILALWCLGRCCC